jgi:biotin synthase
LSHVARQEVVDLLLLQGSERQQLFAQSRAVRQQRFGDVAVVRGVIEVTSVCIQNCTYCPMRRDNRVERYILRPDEIVAVARDIRSAGIRVVSLQGGDTPRTTRIVAEAIEGIREIFAGEVDILLVLGDKSRREYAHLRALGATSYILKHETSDERLHLKHRFYPLAHRLQHLTELLELGYQVGTGTIVGLPGQTIEMLADDILLARSLGVHMCSASPFVPAQGTPLSDALPGSIDLTLNVIAATRLLMPEALIPSVSALEKHRPGAQASGLDAGANVITVNFTPPHSQERYPIYGSDRFIVRRTYATETLRQAGLKSSLTSDAENLMP